jgi:adenylosuccinate synthase
MAVLEESGVNYVHHYAPLHYLPFIARSGALLGKPSLAAAGFAANHLRSKSSVHDVKRGFGAYAFLTLDPTPRILGAKLMAGFPHIGIAVPVAAVEGNFRGSTTSQLEAAYRRGDSILLEGTQGSGLSLYHGAYPYVTSRETNVAGCLAEAGISPSRVRRILMVIRPTPIRVGNPDGDQGHTSGPLKHETNFEEVAKQARLDPAAVKAQEKTSTTKRDRRVGWFEWDQFRQACALNAPTDIVLTFADYLDAKNANARRFEQLEQNTIKFIEEIERVAHAPVSLINTRFPRTEQEMLDLRTVIDRRNWVARR